MLMKVVLPAPLVPMRPTTESFSIAASMAFAAVTAPNLLQRFFASRITGISGKNRPQTVGKKNNQQQQSRAERELPGVGRKVVGRAVDRAEDEGADEGRHDAARAGEDGDEDEFARGRPVGH